MSPAAADPIPGHGNSDTVAEEKNKAPMDIIWPYVIAFVFLHIGSFYGIYLAFTSAMWKTAIFSVFLGIFSGLGITAGVHRLWSHRSYKAKLPLRIFLALANTMAYERDIYHWCRNHRTHHKYAETNADPHNAKRGFFFSHIGWMMVPRHPEVIEKGSKVDLSDVLADPVVRFQKKYYYPLVAIVCFILPTVIPVMLWGESISNSFFVAAILRYTLIIHDSFLVNSAAHMWGNRPYDKNIGASENRFTIFVSMGEGYHNYHHTFPWDYAASEHGITFNLTTAFINAAAWLGLAYDLKSVSSEAIRERKEKTGEHSEDLSASDAKLTHYHSS